MAAYQAANTGLDESQFDMLRKLELTGAQFAELRDHCREAGIEFLSTAFDLESVAALRELGIRRWKVPSGEVTDLPYLEKIAETGLPVILSTGMCEMAEVEQAVAALRQGGSRDITLLHCTSEYPAPYGEVNLRAMLTMREKFGLPVGYSDHTAGIEIPIAAAALGAGVIEKHFTLDRTMPGPDHRASLEPEELRAMVQAVRHVESALGDGVKAPGPSERKNIAVVRKSIVAARPIRRGERLTAENLTAKRPGGGLSPMRWHEVLGTAAIRDFAADEPLELAGTAPEARAGENTPQVRPE